MGEGRAEVAAGAGHDLAIDVVRRRGPSDSGVVTTVSRQPRLPHAQQRATRVDDDVADLAGGVSRAGEQLVVDHEAGTDALGDAHEQDVSRFAGDEGQLTEGGGVGVVGDAHGQPEGGGQLRAEGDVVEAEVGGADDDAVGVDDAGRGHADPEQGAVGLAGELAGDLDGRRGEALAGQAAAQNPGDGAHCDG